MDTFPAETGEEDYFIAIAEIKKRFEDGNDMSKIIDEYYRSHPFLNCRPYAGCNLGRNISNVAYQNLTMLPNACEYGIFLNYEAIYSEQLLKFEDTEFWAPADPDAYLRKCYADYMSMPNRYGVHTEDPELLFSEIY